MPCVLPLGWRSSTALVGEQPTSDNGDSIVEASLVDGKVTPLAQFNRAGCGLNECDVYRIQLATNLLAYAGVRDASNPDRGPWALIVHDGLIVLVFLLVGLLILFVVKSVRKRRARRNPLSAPASREPASVAS
jgi:hypothetical protein